MIKLHHADRLGSESAHSLADPGIPTLQAVLDPRELGKHLNRVLAPELGLVRDIQTKVLLHHPEKRCTIDITLETITGKHELIGKVYASDRSDVYRAMEEISQSGFGPEEEFSIPQPLAFIPELRLLLQEKVRGTSATEIFSTGNDSELANAAERCARWLARFQDKAPLLGPVFLPTQELMAYGVRPGKRLGSLADKSRLLLKRLEMMAPGLEPTEMCACHASYSHRQIILSETRTATFDWDHYCVADPTRDVARFIVNLQKLALGSRDSLKALDAANETFYKTYKATSRFEVGKHLPFYKAAHCLMRARYCIEPLLDEGLRILAEEV
jgi:hypothetical protein